MVPHALDREEASELVVERVAPPQLGERHRKQLAGRGERMHGENSESGSQRVKSSHTMVIYGPFHADLRDCNPSDDSGHPWEVP